MRRSLETTAIALLVTLVAYDLGCSRGGGDHAPSPGTNRSATTPARTPFPWTRCEPLDGALVSAPPTAASGALAALSSTPTAAASGAPAATVGALPRCEGLPSETVECVSAHRILWVVDNDVATRGDPTHGWRWLLDKRPSFRVEACANGGALFDQWPGSLESIQSISGLGAKDGYRSARISNGAARLPETDEYTASRTPATDVLARVRADLGARRLDLVLFAFDGVPDGGGAPQLTPQKALVEELVAFARDGLGVFVVAAPETAHYVYVFASPAAIAYARALMPSIRAAYVRGHASGASMFEIAPGPAGPNGRHRPDGAVVSLGTLEGGDTAPVPTALMVLVDGAEARDLSFDQVVAERRAHVALNARGWLRSFQPSRFAIRLAWTRGEAPPVPTSSFVRAPVLYTNLAGVAVSGANGIEPRRIEDLASVPEPLALSGVDRWRGACGGEIPRRLFPPGDAACGLPDVERVGVYSYLVLDRGALTLRVVRDTESLAPRDLERALASRGDPGPSWGALAPRVSADRGRLPAIGLVSPPIEPDACLIALDAALASLEWTPTTMFPVPSACGAEGPVASLARSISAAPFMRFLRNTWDAVPGDRRAGASVLVALMRDALRRVPASPCSLATIRLQAECPSVRGR